jgi:hypothetical protein
MPASFLDTQSLVGKGLPYVFVEGIKIQDANLRQGDYHPISDPLTFIKNEYGTNRTTVSDNTKDKNYFSNNNVYSVELNIFLNEFLLRNLWYNKGATKNLKIKIIQSTHPLLTEQILNEDIRDVTQFDRKHRKFLQERVLSVSTNRPLTSYRVKRLDYTEDTLCSIPLRTKFIVNSQHLTYFLFVHGVGGYRKSFRTIERVFENNRPKQKSSIFYLPNNKVYSGPVHYNPGSGWMTGERHTSKSHPTLRKVDHLNLKIQDYRIFDSLRRAQNSIRLSSSPESGRKVFSDLYLSRDKNKAARGLFVFDCVEYLKRNGRYGKILEYADVDKVMPHMRIRELKIVRRRQEAKGRNDYDFEDQQEQYDLVAVSGDNEGTKKLSRRSYYIDLNTDGKLDTLVGTVGEKTIFNLGSKRAFSFYDSYIRNYESGKYAYGVEMVIEDPTIKYFSLQIENLRKAHTMLSDYHRFVTKYARLSPDGKISIGFLDTIRQKYNLGSVIGEPGNGDAPWRKSVRIYLKVIRNLTGASSNLLKDNLYRLLVPASRSLRGVEIFLSIIENLILKLTKDNITSPTNAKHGTRQGSNKRSPLLYLSKNFNNTFHADTIKDYGLDFYGDALRYNLDGLATISIGRLRKRFAAEAQKLGINLPKTVRSPGAENFYSRLTPVSADLSGNSFDFTGPPSSRDELYYYLAHIKRLRLKNNAAARSVSVPEQGVILAGGEKDKNTIAKLYSEQASLGGQGATFSTATEDDAGLLNSQADAKMPGGEDDKFNTTSQDVDRDKEKEKEKELQTIVKEIGLGKIQALASTPGGSAHDAFDEDSSVSIKYGTFFDDNLDLNSASAPYSPRNSYLLVLGADSKGRMTEQEDLYDSVVLVTKSDRKVSKDDTLFLGDPDKEQSKKQGDKAGPPPGPPPGEQEIKAEDDNSSETGDASDSNSDASYSTNYIENMDTVERPARGTSLTAVEIPAIPVRGGGSTQAYVRGAGPSASPVANRRGGTMTGGGGRGY